MPQQANNASTAPAATESQNPKQTAAAADPVGGSQSADNRPATVAELEAACPGASSDFLLDCARKSMTLSQATDAFIGWQSAQIRARDEQIAQLNTDLQARDKQIAELQAGGGQASASRKPGVPVIEADDKNAAAATAPAVDSDDPAAVAKAEWEANANNCRESFVSEAAYVGYRKAQLRGQIRRDSKRRGK